jgi:hypothetical protein
MKIVKVIYKFHLVTCKDGFVISLDYVDIYIYIYNLRDHYPQNYPDNLFHTLAAVMLEGQCMYGSCDFDCFYAQLQWKWR